MRRVFGVICAGSFALAAGSATAILPAAASPYSSMVVFGDSLSDSGNAAIAVGATAPAITGNTYIPSHPYLPSADFSNGPVWASDVASALGVPLLPSFIPGGTNFAVGGATTGGPFPDARAALGLIGGDVDVTSTIQSTALSFAANIASIVTSLKAGGAQHIIVWDTPNIGLAPAVAAGGIGAAMLGSLLATDMNLALAGILAGDTGVSILRMPAAPSPAPIATPTSIGTAFTRPRRPIR